MPDSNSQDSLGFVPHPNLLDHHPDSGAGGDFDVENEVDDRAGCSYGGIPLTPAPLPVGEGLYPFSPWEKVAAGRMRG